jgi:hypothetical protein
MHGTASAYGKSRTGKKMKCKSRFFHETATQMMVRQDMNWAERYRRRTRMGNGTGSCNGSESSYNESDADSLVELQVITMSSSEQQLIHTFLNLCNLDTCVPISMKDIPFIIKNRIK